RFCHARWTLLRARPGHACAPLRATRPNRGAVDAMVTTDDRRPATDDPVRRPRRGRPDDQQPPDPRPVLGSRFLVLAVLGCGSALLYMLLWLRFPLQVIYTCPRTNLDKLPRVEATPAGLPLTSYACPTENLDNLTRPDVMTGL